MFKIVRIPFSGMRFFTLEVAVLRGLQIKNFSILRDFKIGADKESLLVDLQAGKKLRKIGLLSMNAIIGRNSSGKSTIFNALSFLRDLLLYNLPHAASRKNRGGLAKLFSNQANPEEEVMSFVLLFDWQDASWLEFSIELALDIHSRPSIQSEKVDLLKWEDGQLKSSPILELFEGEGRLHDEGFSQIIQLVDRKQTGLSIWGRMRQNEELVHLYQEMSHWFIRGEEELESTSPSEEKGGHKHLDEAFSNLENVLNYLQSEDSASYESMMNRLLSRMPQSIRRKKLPTQEGRNSGNRLLFTTLLLLEDPRPLICLDDPGRGLYYDMIDVMAEELRAYSLDHPKSQIFVTTHDYNLLAHFHPNEVWVMEEDEEGVHARFLGADPIIQSMYNEGLNLGMLWYGGHLGVE